MEREKRPDWWGRGIGLLVFCGGIALLAFVFFRIQGLANNLRTPSAGTKDWSWVPNFGIELLLLVLSGLVASWIAGAGARFYAAAGAAAAD